MAYDFLNAIDLHDHELQNAIAHKLASDPAGKADGYWYYNTTDGTFKFKQGGTFDVLGAAALNADTDPTLAAPLKTAGHSIRESIGADVGSATSLTLGADGNYFNITGTVNVEGIAGIQVGMQVTLAFASILDLVHNATSFILPSSTDITTATGDVAVFREISAGNWKCVSYTRADGTPLVGGGGGSSQPFSDATAHIHDAADATKLIRFDAGLIATGNTRILQAPDADAVLGVKPIERSFYSAGGNLITNAQLKVMVVRRPLKVTDLQAEVDDPGDGDVQIRLLKNDVLVGTLCNVNTVATSGNTEWGAQAQANIAYAAGDLMEIQVISDGDSGASGGTAAAGPLDVLILACYDPT